MKKVLLSAFALVTVSLSYGKDCKELSKVKLALNEHNECTEGMIYPCVYNIIVKNRNGDVVKTIPYNGTARDAQGCCDWSDNNVAIWTKQFANSPSYTVESDLQI